MIVFKHFTGFFAEIGNMPGSITDAGRYGGILINILIISILVTPDRRISCEFP